MFDEDTWTVRYLEVDIGSFFMDKRVLIPREFLGNPDWTNKHFPIQLTVEMIKNSPDLDFDKPVSRKYEEQLFNHYELQPYWASSIAAYGGRPSMLIPEAQFMPPRETSEPEEVDTSLRSFNEIKGYYINSIDERFGHIDDIIIDDDQWEIFFVILDTKNIIPWSKKVMLPIEIIQEINFFR